MSEKIIVCRAVIPIPIDGVIKICLGKNPPDKKHSSGLWTPPGGKPEPKEPLHLAIIRETIGETGAITDPYDYLFPTQVTRPDGTEIVTHYYLCGARSSTIARGPHDDKPTVISWFSLEEIKNLGLNLTASAAEAVKHLEKFNLAKWVEILYPDTP